MAPRRLLSDEERQALFGIPLDVDGMARCFTLSRADQELVAARRRDARDFPDRKFASIEPATTYKCIQPLFGRRIRTDVIREHWDDVLRLVASLKAGTVLPSAMLKRLAAFRRQNQLDFALQELGRIERTLFMLDWLESPQLRQLCQAGLNKSEQRHALAQVICTFKQGRIADRGLDAQEFRASGLNLVIAAIVYWNSTYLADAVEHLRRLHHPVPVELLAIPRPHLGAYRLLRRLSVGPSRCHSRATPASQCQAGKHGSMTRVFTKRSLLALSSEQPTLCPL